ncbi:MAG: DUF4367 domain-containing protein [Blautia sp.]|nr:DUF4367 domain-containing protein [Blautia sp.]
MNKYTEVMERIEIDEAMKNRILCKVRAKTEKEKRFSKIRKYVMAEGVVAAAILVMVLSPWRRRSPSELAELRFPSVATEQGGTDFETSNELSEGIGFTVKLPDELPYPVSNTTFTMIGSGVAQVEYQGEDESFQFTQSTGEMEAFDDIGAYETETQVQIEDITVSMLGNEEEVYLAIWSDEDYTYTISNTVGISEGDMIQLVDSVVSPDQDTVPDTDTEPPTEEETEEEEPVTEFQEEKVSAEDAG